MERVLPSVLLCHHVMAGEKQKIIYTDGSAKMDTIKI